MNNNPLGLWIYSFGGHARSVADVAISAGIKNIVFADDSAKLGENFQGFSVVKSFTHPLPDGWRCFPAAGDNQKRQAQIELIKSLGLPLATIISPRATIGKGSQIGEGTFIGHHAHIGPLACVGEGCIINTASLLDHDSALGAFSHISINAAVAGGCRLGKNVYLGAGATVIHNCRVVDDVVIGAGSTVIKNLEDSGTYVGSPARRIS
jgi:UDP-N-acetylbacillosamine N-acetyltransferase